MWVYHKRPADSPTLCVCVCVCACVFSHTACVIACVCVRLWARLRAEGGGWLQWWWWCRGGGGCWGWWLRLCEWDVRVSLVSECLAQVATGRPTSLALKRKQRKMHRKKVPSLICEATAWHIRNLYAQLTTGRLIFPLPLSLSSSLSLSHTHTHTHTHTLTLSLSLPRSWSNRAIRSEATLNTRHVCEALEYIFHRACVWFAGKDCVWTNFFMIYKYIRWVFLWVQICLFLINKIKACWLSLETFSKPLFFFFFLNSATAFIFSVAGGGRGKSDAQQDRKSRDKKALISTWVLLLEFTLHQCVVGH